MILRTSIAPKERVSFDTEPRVLSQQIKQWPCMSHWSIEYLKACIGEHLVKVNQSRDGKFSITSSRHEEKSGSRSLPMAQFLDAISDTQFEHVLYLQQYSIPNTFPALLKDLGEIHFLDKHHLREMNLWISHNTSQIPLHYDRSDNLLVQVVGKKRIRLWSPNKTSQLYPGYQNVNFASPIDPDNVDRATFVHYQEPDIELTLHAGEALYLPAYWWHHVITDSQYAVSVNYWYDTAAQIPNQALRNYLEKGQITPLEHFHHYHRTLINIFKAYSH